MSRTQEKDRQTSIWFRAWFALTSKERLLLASALLIFLVGLAARYFYLKNQVSRPYDPPKAENRERGR
jgi:hypothetical protein